MVQMWQCQINDLSETTPPRGGLDWTPNQDPCVSIAYHLVQK